MEYESRINHDGKWYVGKFANDKRNGKGILKWTHGRTYDGYWIREFCEGEEK